MHHRAPVVAERLEVGGRHRDVTGAKIVERNVRVRRRHKLLLASARADSTVGGVDGHLGARLDQVERLPEETRRVRRARAVQLAHMGALDERLERGDVNVLAIVLPGGVALAFAGDDLDACANLLLGRLGRLEAELLGGSGKGQLIADRRRVVVQ